MRAEIPAYAAAADGLLEDVRHQIRLHHETKLRCLLAEEDVTSEDLAFTRGAAMRRARAGLALEDYINAFRIGQQVVLGRRARGARARPPRGARRRSRWRRR